MYDLILMVGPPGSGKSTVSKRLESNYNMVHVSSGELVRKGIEDRLKEDVKGGDFITDQDALRIVKNEFVRLEKETNYDPLTDYILLDGTPRTVEQVPMLNEFCNILQVIYLAVPNTYLFNNGLVDRIKSRVSETDRIEDKDERVILGRIQKFWNLTYPLIAKYDSIYSTQALSFRNKTSLDTKDKIYGEVVRVLKDKKIL